MQVVEFLYHVTNIDSRVRSSKCIQPPPGTRLYLEALLQGTAAVMARLDMKGGGGSKAPMPGKPLSLLRRPFAQLPPYCEADLGMNTSWGKVCAELCLFLKHEDPLGCRGDEVDEHRLSDADQG
jgi:hypothetical protein